MQSPVLRYLTVLPIAVIAGFFSWWLVPGASAEYLLPAAVVSLVAWVPFALLIGHYNCLATAISLGLLAPLLSGLLLGPHAFFVCLVGYPRLSLVGAATGIIVLLCVRPPAVLPSAKSLALELAIARQRVA